MSNFVERFKLRSVPDLVLDCTVGPMTFKVHRFAEEEKRGARKLMTGRLKEEGYDLKGENAADQPAQNVAFAIGLAEIIKRHVHGWSLDDEFSESSLSALWSEMSDVDRVELASAYLTAESEALKKSAETSHRNSLNGSSAGSNTKSENRAQIAADA